MEVSTNTVFKQLSKELYNFIEKLQDAYVIL